MSNDGYICLIHCPNRKPTDWWTLLPVVPTEGMKILDTGEQHGYLVKEVVLHAELFATGTDKPPAKLPLGSIRIVVTEIELLAD